jgi:hypothetical protein
LQAAAVSGNVREEEIGVDNKERDKEQLVAVFLLPSQVCTCLATFLFELFLELCFLRF